MKYLPAFLILLSVTAQADELDDYLRLRAVEKAKGPYWGTPFTEQVLGKSGGILPQYQPNNTQPAPRAAQGPDTRPWLAFYTQPGCDPCKAPAAAFAALTPAQLAALPYRLYIGPPAGAVSSTPYFTWQDSSGKWWGTGRFGSVAELTNRFNVAQEQAAAAKLKVIQKVAVAAAQFCAKAKAAVTQAYQAVGGYARHWDWPARHGSLKNHLRRAHGIDSASWSQDEREIWHDNYHDAHGP